LAWIAGRDELLVGATVVYLRVGVGTRVSLELLTERRIYPLHISTLDGWG